MSKFQKSTNFQKIDFKFFSWGYVLGIKINFIIFIESDGGKGYTPNSEEVGKISYDRNRTTYIEWGRKMGIKYATKLTLK